MEEAIIRFEGEQQQWKDWQSRAQSKYGEVTIKSPQFQKDYLTHLEGLEIKYRTTANKYEHLELNILKAKRREIEKFLYPNKLIRLAYRFFRAREMKTAAVAFIENKQVSIDQLADALKKKGFTGLKQQLSKEIKINQTTFSIPVTLQISETERMQYELHFAKDVDKGYVIKDIKATLTGEQIKSKQSLLYSSISVDDLSVKQAYNLLSGRAIEKADGWVMLDLNDRDAEGNLRSKRFSKDYGFSVEQLIEQSGIKGLDNPAFKKELLESLRQGDCLKVSVGKGIVEIEANPVHHCLEKPTAVIERRQHEMRQALEKKQEIEKVKKTTTMKIRVG